MRDIINDGLYPVIQIPITDMDTDIPRPPKPFLGFRVTTPFAPVPGEEHITYAPIDGVDDQLEETRLAIGTLTSSFSIYSDDITQTRDLAATAHHWFAWDGREYLSDNNLTVIEALSIENRDTYIENEWERRQGFDVTFRVYKEYKRNIDAIDKVIINNDEVKT